MPFGISLSISNINYIDLEPNLNKIPLPLPPTHMENAIKVKEICSDDDEHVNVNVCICNNDT